MFTMLVAHTTPSASATPSVAACVYQSYEMISKTRIVLDPSPYITFRESGEEKF